MKKIIFIVFTLLSLSVFASEVIEVDKLKPLINTNGIEASDKVLLIYLWATWCPDCKEKLTKGGLAGLQTEFPKLKIVTVNSDRDEERAKGFSESEKITLPVFRDDSRHVTKALKLFAVPAWAILERDETGKWVARKKSTGSELQEIRIELKKVL